MNDGGWVEVGRVLAHQGGWDEAILLAAPLVVFGGLLWLAGRRARREAEQQQDSTD